jgi:hypothetical protein
MFGFREVDAAEVAFGEDDAFTAKTAQIVVAKVVTGELTVDPLLVEAAHRQPGSELRFTSAYSVIAISAARAECRSRASTFTTGM